eukprot:jgi/Hompol1/6305/HPOL_004930-RA
MSASTTVAEIQSFDDATLQRPLVRSALARVAGVVRWKETFAPPSPSMLRAVQNSALDAFALDPPPVTKTKTSSSPSSSSSSTSSSTPPSPSPSSSIVKARIPPGSNLPAHKPLDKMSSAEWLRWLNHARSLRSEWAKLLSSDSADPDTVAVRTDQWREFLGIDKLPRSHDPIHPVHYSSNLPQDSSNAASVPKVKGRLLNNVKGTDFAVGIGGIVAFMHRTKTPKGMFDSIDSYLSSGRSPIDRSRTHEFWVLKAEHDHLGRPDVIVSMQDPNLDSFSYLPPPSSPSSRQNMPISARFGIGNQSRSRSSSGIDKLDHALNQTKPTTRPFAQPQQNTWSSRQSKQSAQESQNGLAEAASNRQLIEKLKGVKYAKEPLPTSGPVKRE